MRRVRCLALLSVIFCATPAFASPPSAVMQLDSDSVDSSTSGNQGLFGEKSQTMLGNMWGLRSWLAHYGLSLNILETSEVLGNVSGGIHRGFAYDGLTQAELQMDTQAAFGWRGGTFDISALQIHGRNLSTENLGSLQTASGIEANRGTRLWQLWYDQKFLDEERMDVRLGLQSIDQEFMVSDNALLFVNTMFGWPMVPSADMPNGGPAYPLSAPGVRFKASPDDSFTVLAGVFNGSPSNANGLNQSGTDFPMSDGVLGIAELQYSYPALGAMVDPDDPNPLSGTYKIGFWYDSENFADQRFGTDGLSLSNPASNGNPRMHHGNYAIYGVADQMLWHSEELDDRTLHFFTRVMGTPQANRNLVDFSANAGFVLHEPIAFRDNDTFGVGFGYAHVSNRAAQADQDASLYNPGTYTPIRRSETYIETTYQYQVTPWWQVQPDFQYVFNPGAGTTDESGNRVRNEAVIGLRTNIAF